MAESAPVVRRAVPHPWHIDSAHTDSAHTTVPKAPGGRKSRRHAECVPEVVLRPAGHDRRHCTGTDGGCVVEKAVHYLVQRAVSAYGHDAIAAIRQCLSHKRSGVPRAGGPAH